MKNLMYFFISLIYLTGFNDSYGGRYQNWVNEEEMSPYYSAIQHIRTQLEPCIQKHKDSILNGFEAWSSPNPSYCRTPRYLFLETDTYSNSERIGTLYTPLGEVKLLVARTVDSLTACSTEFLDIMKEDWALKEVTDIVKVYNFSHFRKEGEKLYGPYKFKSEPWEGASIQNHLYLIQRVNGHVFVQNDQIVPDNMVIYKQALFRSEQRDRDERIFSSLSGGKNTF
jgi:hypothetical protein